MSSEPTRSDTRERILDAAARLLESRGPNVSMSEIANAAGVTRQTVYLQFGDRTRLFFELPSYLVRRDTAWQAMRAAVDLPPLEAFEGFFRNWIRTAAKLARVLRPIWIGAEGDEELMSAVRQSDLQFQATFYQPVFRKLHQAGYLRPMWSAKEAASAAWATTMYGVFVRHLQNMSGWSAEEIEERGLKVLRATFLTEEATRAARKIRVK